MHDDINGMFTWEQNQQRYDLVAWLADVKEYTMNLKEVLGGRKIVREKSGEYNFLSLLALCITAMNGPDEAAYERYQNFMAPNPVASLEQYWQWRKQMQAAINAYGRALRTEFECKLAEGASDAEANEFKDDQIERILKPAFAEVLERLKRMPRPAKIEK